MIREIAAFSSALNAGLKPAFDSDPSLTSSLPRRPETLFSDHPDSLMLASRLSIIVRIHAGGTLADMPADVTADRGAPDGRS